MNKKIDISNQNFPKMEEESGALEVEDAGAESSDSPAEVRLLSHFYTVTYLHFHTFILSQLA